MPHAISHQTLGSVNVRLAKFSTGTDVDEYQLALSIDDEAAHLSYAEQLRQLCVAFETVRQQTKANPVFKRYFISDAANQTTLLMNYELAYTDYELSVIEQPPANGTKVALWCYLMTNVNTKANVSGLYEVQHGSYRHLWSANNTAQAETCSAQTKLLLNDYVMQLMNEGCTLRDNCVRTWFYVNDIDQDYNDVVKARNEVFYTQGMNANTHFISSTGIGGRQADNQRLCQMDSYAIYGLREGQMCHLYAPDHLCRTVKYGVSFERGVYIDYGDRRHVFISGTASIDRDGNIVSQGDILGQCERVWQNIEALLNEANCEMKDLQMVICTIRHASDFNIVRQWISHKIGNNVPHMLVCAHICRPNWLVEMECIAARKIKTDYPVF